MSLVAAFSLSPPDSIVNLTSSSQREDCRGSTVPKERKKKERDGATKEGEIEGRDRER